LTPVRAATLKRLRVRKKSESRLNAFFYRIFFNANPHPLHSKALN
jgi:hypothetical protein